LASTENTILARLEKGGEKFELIVDSKLAYDYKTGARKDLANVLIAEEVFKDAHKGERHTSTALNKAFGTTDVYKIAEVIFREGEVQLTTDQRRKLFEEKKLKVISLIARNAVDPRTKTPHPPQRIEAAMEQAKVHVDAFKAAEKQVPGIVDKIREIIPISMENARIAIKISAEHAPRAYGVLREYGLSREEWGNDGSLTCVCELPAGMQGEFFERLNRLTSGQVQTKIL